MKKLFAIGLAVAASLAITATASAEEERSFAFCTNTLNNTFQSSIRGAVRSGRLFLYLS